MRWMRLCGAALTGLATAMIASCATGSSSQKQPMTNAATRADVTAQLPAAVVPAASAVPLEAVLPVPEGPVVVFFDFNSDRLSAEGMKIIQRASTVYRTNGFPKLLIEGHADRTGTDPYNEWLGKQRAEAVKVALQNQGIDGKVISIKSYGNSRPLIVTTKGVREPQNRRAEIQVR
jgi:OmpA-OmpF porin, OOP family